MRSPPRNANCTNRGLSSGPPGDHLAPRRPRLPQVLPPLRAQRRRQQRPLRRKQRRSSKWKEDPYNLPGNIRSPTWKEDPNNHHHLQQHHHQFHDTSRIRFESHFTSIVRVTTLHGVIMVSLNTLANVKIKACHGQVLVWHAADKAQTMVVSMYHLSCVFYQKVLSC